MIGQKALASLSSGLLARKGHARPAMRPQGFGAMISNNPDDLGWNDMGHEPQSPAPAPATVSIAEAPVAMPLPAASLVAPVVPAIEDVPTPPVSIPSVLVQREALKEEIEAPVAEAPVAEADAAPAALRPVSLATATRIDRETKHKNRAAFTLRLDQERHLRLRLASALDGRSSQRLVTEALDAFLRAFPEVEALASQVPVKTHTR